MTACLKCSRGRRGSHRSCTKHPTYNMNASRIGVYCKRRAVDGMVNIHGNRFIHDSGGKRTIYNVAESKSSMCCADPAEDGMVNVRLMCCRSDA